MFPGNRQALLTLLVACSIFVSSTVAHADSETELLREELRATRSALEARIAALEARLQSAQPAAAADTQLATERLDVVETRLQQVEIASQAPAPTTQAGASSFNPQMSVILAGSWANLSADPEDYRLQGFVPAGDEGGPGDRGFSLGETELTLSANIDPLFFGQVTLAVEDGSEIATEEAFVRSTALPHGVTAQAGRFYSGLGYLNSQHAHRWDFGDRPLVYEAMFGGQYANEGAQLRWLAPLDTFVELGVEIGNGREFPGEDSGNGVGSYTVFASTGNDIGASASWKAGIAWLDADATERGYEEPDRLLTDTFNPSAFSGNSETWNVYAVYKWAPQGNSRQRNLTLQGEYFQRREDGTLSQHNAARGDDVFDYRGEPAGWYVQGVYQFRPDWRLGLRHDELDSGSLGLRSLGGALRAADFPTLRGYEPSRDTLMLDYAPSEYSRLRLQYAREQSAPGGAEEQIHLQYLMSLGAHGAHQF